MLKARAIILAAGASTRMGRSKPLLRKNQITMLEAVCEPYKSIDISPIVVTGFNAPAVESHASSLGIMTVRNRAPWRGMASSVRSGLQHLPPEAELVFIHPVDCPGVKSSTLSLLASSLTAFSCALAAKPVYQGKGGHPLILARKAWMRMLSDRRLNLRSLLAAIPGQVLRIETDDPSVLRDLDTREQLQGWLEEGGEFRTTDYTD